MAHDEENVKNMSSGLHKFGYGWENLGVFWDSFCKNPRKLKKNLKKGLFTHKKILN